jgi:hypothetical protein
MLGSLKAQGASTIFLIKVAVINIILHEHVKDVWYSMQLLPDPAMGQMVLEMEKLGLDHTAALT